MVADEFDGVQDVLKAFEPLMKDEMRLLAHHRPLEPMDQERWGGGCCYFETTGKCHFGHHDNPLSLYSFNYAGKMRVEGTEIYIDTAEGEAKQCFVEFLVGHRSQIVVTTIPNLEDFDEKVKSFDPSNIENPTIENLTERLSELSKFMAEMNDLKNGL